MTRQYVVTWICDRDTSHTATVGPDELHDPVGWVTVRWGNRTREFCPEDAAQALAILEGK